MFWLVKTLTWFHMNCNPKVEGISYAGLRVAADTPAACLRMLQFWGMRAWGNFGTNTRSVFFVVKTCAQKLSRKLGCAFLLAFLATLHMSFPSSAIFIQLHAHETTFLSSLSTISCNYHGLSSSRSSTYFPKSYSVCSDWKPDSYLDREFGHHQQWGPHHDIWKLVKSLESMMCSCRALQLVVSDWSLPLSWRILVIGGMIILCISVNHLSSKWDTVAWGEEHLWHESCKQ